MSGVHAIRLPVAIANLTVASPGAKMSGPTMSGMSVLAIAPSGNAANHHPYYRFVWAHVLWLAIELWRPLHDVWVIFSAWRFGFFA